MSKLTFPRSALVHGVGSVLIAYCILTIVSFVPRWNSLDNVQSFAVAKNVGEVFLLVVLLYIRPRIGSVVVLVWCVVAPMGRYAQLLNEVREGALTNLAVMDAVRIVLLLSAAILSGLLAYYIFSRPDDGKVA